ncbi:DUF4815 domain-containing protein [Thermomicrobium sp. CFH 73360]|uniref:DUF4815 domain-containing protein n=1 Tax=Thermomicrobium sp. CFH 73360 TaxID=2951987 RepID=UPI00207743A8|nr:DUF4815 domain-containing protein [Thermomicrobium sp. CFH 73360]MCM8746194.1 DUF4815 domain-containing protein [Thermomicrobium sp. CFH 73360]
MPQRMRRLLLALILVAAAFAAQLAPAAALWTPMTPVSSTWQVNDQLIIPYVPNNELLAGTGPWHGVVQIANASSFAVAVDIAKADGTPITTVNIPGNGSTALAAAALFGTNPGGGLLLFGHEVGACASQAVQQYTVTRQAPANSADTVTLTVPGGVNVTHVSVSQGSTWYPPVVYAWNQVGTTLNIDWTPGGAEPATNSTYQVVVAYDFPCRPARLSAAVKLVAPAPSTNGRTSNSHVMVSGYSGLSQQQGLGSDLAVPIAQANYNGWKTVIHITNFGGGPCAATALFYQHPSGAQTHLLSQSIAAGATWNLDLQAAGLPTGWLGTARIQGPGCFLAASVDRVKPTQPWGTPVNMALTNVALPVTSLSPTVYIPLVFQAYFDWNTGIAVTNVGGGPANVTINYYSTTGSLLGTKNLTIPGNSMNFDYLSGSGGQLAQAVLTSSAPIVVSVDAVKYTGGGQDVGQALTSMGINDPVSAPVLRVPLYQKQGVSGNDNSGVQIFNISATTPATVTVDFFDAAGTAQPPSPLTLAVIAPRGAVTVYAPNYGALPNNFQGQVRVSQAPGSGQVVAITNNVNYDVQNDGSAAFNVATADRALRVDYGPGPGFKNGVHTFLVAQTVDENGVQISAQQLIVSGPGLMINGGPSPQIVNTSMFGIATVEIWGTNTTVPVTVCWDLNTNGTCQPTEPQVTQTMSWTP